MDANQPSSSTLTKDQLAAAASSTPVTDYTLADGLAVKVIQQGSGTAAKTGDLVTVNYIGTLANGTEFDSSLKPGRTPFQFHLGAGEVIKGWDEGVAGMQPGEVRVLVIPPALGYGSQDVGNGLIPPNSTLHFTIQLLEAK